MNTFLRTFLCGLSIFAIGMTGQAAGQTLLRVDFNGWYYNVTEDGFTGLNPAAEGGTANFPAVIGDYSVSVTGAASQWASNQPNLAVALYTDYIAASFSMTLAISGLDASAQYSLRTYNWKGEDADPVTLTYTPVDGTIGTQASYNSIYDPRDTDFSSVDENSTLMLLTSNASGVLSLQIDSSSFSNAVMNGFELSVVPEPTTGTMLGLGIAGILGLSRRRKITN